jgi:hypothetical protein
LSRATLLEEKVSMLFVVIERFRTGAVSEAYRRFNERGRLAPDALKTLGSWVAADLSRCVQIVEADDASSIQRWVANWADLIDFEIFPASEGAAAAGIFAGAR